MSEQNIDSRRRYRLVAIRTDTSIATVLGGMTWNEARQAMVAIQEAAIFKSVYIKPDKADTPSSVAEDDGPRRSDSESQPSGA
jgi:hypothetical protein